MAVTEECDFCGKTMNGPIYNIGNAIDVVLVGECCYAGQNEEADLFEFEGEPESKAADTDDSFGHYDVDLRFDEHQQGYYVLIYIDTDNEVTDVDLSNRPDIRGKKALIKHMHELNTKLEEERASSQG